MTGQELADHLEQHPDLETLGIHEGALLVSHPPSKACWAITHHVLKVRGGADWQTLEAILTGKREPNPIIHMTRIVGYYSDTANWNKSAIGQLADRRKGDYSIPEAKEGGAK